MTHKMTVNLLDYAKERARRFFSFSRKDELLGVTERGNQFIELLQWIAKSESHNDSQIYSRFQGILRRCNIEINGVSQDFWKEMLPKIVRQKVTLEADFQLNKKILQNSSLNDSAKECLIIYQLLILTGFFQSALSLRTIARAKILEEARAGKYLMGTDAFSAALEVRDFELAARHSTISADRPESRAMTVFAPEWTLGLLEEGEDDSRLKTLLRSVHDRDYAMFLNARSVAIVGAAPESKESRDELAGFDIVIRTNFLPDEQRDAVRSGPSQHQASYFTNDFLKKTTDASRESDLRELDFCIFRRSSWIRRTKHVARRSRVIHRFPWLLNGIPNAIPTLLYDTCLYSPSRIKVFNTTLMLKTEGGLFRDGYPQENRPLIESFAWHDPVTQFLMIKNLYLSKRIEVEERLKKILCMSEAEYMQRLRMQFFQ